MKRLIFGTGDLAQTLWYHLSKEGIEITAFILTIEGGCTIFCGKPVVGLLEAVHLYPPGEYGVYICIGYRQMNTGRKAIFNEVSFLGYSILSYIHPTAQIIGDLGSGTLIFQNTSVDYGTNLGIGNILCPNTVISHHNKIGDFNYFSPSSCIAGRISIGNYCFIGANATLKDKINISDYTLVGAGCYVSQNTQPQEVIVPSRSLTLRNHKSTELM